jgi:hypothetical protein
MLPACRTEGEGFSLPTFDLVPSDVEGFMDELWEFQSTFHDCFARSEPRIHFFDYMVGQFSKLERKSIEPIALGVEGGTIRGMQRFISDVSWDEEQMRWNYHQLVADTLGATPFNMVIFVPRAWQSRRACRSDRRCAPAVSSWDREDASDISRGSPTTPTHVTRWQTPW